VRDPLQNRNQSKQISSAGLFPADASQSSLSFIMEVYVFAPGVLPSAAA
jgi:hypothetical protein